jgi:hypothetical protein
MGVAASRDAPDLPQKFDIGEFAAPHVTQSLSRAFPHSAQKLLAPGLFVPHMSSASACQLDQAIRTSFIIRLG